MGYNNYNRDFEIDEEKTAEFLQNAVEKITSEEDIDILTDLIKLYKKNVPLTRRKYVIAYLLKEALKHYHSSSNFKNNRKNNRNRNENRRDNREVRNEIRNERESNRNERVEKAAEVSAVAVEEERPRHPRVEIPEDKATSIFISIGKNRRVYPRDLVGILVAVVGLDRDRIGDIKVLANYSFVQLYTEDAQTAIDKLNGYDYRGRKLAVSYSRQKDSADASLTENEDSEETISADVDSGYEAPVSETSITEEEMSAEDAAALAAAEKAAADKEPFGNI
ncbi:MAG: DbpA RNA binding domain-containing protein [Treponema sp.]|nr:DbpA RNA binding domain-containing protein [Treponema sp.]